MKRDPNAPNSRPNAPNKRFGWTHSDTPSRRRGLRYSDAGFALVELLVAVALLGIAASSALLLFGTMSDRLSIRNLSYSLALSLRQAQSYGVSVRGTEAARFEAGYGIHFDSGDLATFVLFADKNRDEQFNGKYGLEYNESGCLAGDECLQVFRVGGNNKLEKFCAVRSESGSEECSTDSPPLTLLDISFHRPEPDAVIRTNLSSGDPGRYQGARIDLISPRKVSGAVEVGTAGQISIK